MSLHGHPGEDTPDLCVVLTTTATEDEAQAIARGLLSARLAACIQLSQIDSLYLWEGDVAADPEVRLMIKTRQTLAASVVAWLEANHPYDVPQIVVLPVSGAGAGYRQWLCDVTSEAES